MNLDRRHLDESQRSMVAAKVDGLKWGDVKSQKSRETNLSLDQLAAKFSVSPMSIKTARAVRLKGSEELIEAVEQGTINRQICAFKIKRQICPLKKSR